MNEEKKPWDKPNPNKGDGGKMTSAQKAEAKRRARAAGRPYPNLVDNMAAMKESKVIKFSELRKQLDSICFDCDDDSAYGSVEEDFDPTGDEQYEDWDLSEAKVDPNDNSIPFEGPYTKVTPAQSGSKKPAALSRAKHLAQQMKNKMSKMKKDLDEANNADQYTYIDQTKGPVLRGKTGTYVGYTHSATKGKGANILKHNMTKKYYAAGGSSTAFTQKTTLHDTPEDAARAYHKGNLAEASPMIKPPKNEFGKKEDAFAHAKQHGGKVMKKTFIHPTSGMKTVSYVVREETEIDEASKKPNATTRHLRDYPVSDREMVKPVKPEKKKDEKKAVAEGLDLLEAEKNGKKVQLNKPFRTSDGKGKFAVYSKNEKGNVVKVNFGDTTGLTIKTSNPDRRRNFRARHNCDNPGPKHKARYWSCKAWSRDSVSAGLGT